MFSSSADRVQRLKDARREAQLEIEALKQVKHEEYLEYERSVLGSLDVTIAECAQETATTLEEIRKTATEKSKDAVEAVLDAVLAVKPAIHLNSALRIREGN